MEGWTMGYVEIYINEYGRDSLPYHNCLAYNLMKSNTQAGQSFAQKTLRRVRREQIRNHEVAMIVYTYDSYAVFNAKYLIWLLLGLPKEVQERLKGYFDIGFT